MKKKSERLREEIDQLNDEIKSLQKRRDSAQDSFNARTESLEEEVPSEELRSHKIDLEIFNEVIKTKRGKAEQLQQELASVIGQETEEEKYRQFCQMVEEASRLREAYYKTAIEVDNILKEHILEFAEAYRAWKSQASQTQHFASNIAKGFKRSTFVNYVKNGKKDELKAEELIKKAEADGVNLDAILDTEVSSGQHWQYNRHTKDFPDLAFTKYLIEMQKSPIVGKLMEGQNKQVKR